MPTAKLPAEPYAPNASADAPSLLDMAAQRAVPEFFAMATLIMAGYLAVMWAWPASRAHESSALINQSLATALAAAGWTWQRLHTRRYLAGYWLFLAASAFFGILQTGVGVDSMLTGSVVICTVMASQVLRPAPARACWVGLATALLGLFGAQQQGWIQVAAAQPLQGMVLGLALLLLGVLQARLFNRAAQAAAEMQWSQQAELRLQAERTSQAKSDFLSVMSHEIRTPLNGIVGLVSLVQDPKLDEPTRQQFLRMLTQSSQALSALVTGVLEFSRIEAGSIDLMREPFSLKELAEDLDNSFSASAAVKGLFLQVELDASCGDAAVGDPSRLRQIAANYISNAIKFTKAGAIRVRISRPLGDALLRLEVRDSGIGLTEAAQQQLFMPFRQAEAGTWREYGGTGLGLSICERLARLMNGRVGVHSRPGMGSTFWAEVEVPGVPHSPSAWASAQGARAGEGAGKAAAHTAPTPHVTDLGAARVLVVDDNAVNRTVTSQMLRRMNAVVLTAAGGAEGVDAMRQALREGWPFDVVLMDVQMPGMTGLEAVQAVRDDTALALTPVVALTAGVLREDVARAMDAGMDGFLAKPVTAEQLGRSVAHFAEMGRSRRAGAGAGVGAGVGAEAGAATCPGAGWVRF